MDPFDHMHEEKYPALNDPNNANNLDPYAAEALLKAAQLSALFGMNAKANDYYKKLINLERLKYNKVLG